MGVNYDFSGWATRNDLKCSDGRIIRKDAFKDNDGKKVPLVWNHNHNDASNVLGHALLQNREDGVYAYCSLNDTPAAQNAKILIKHGDINALSIYANQLKQNNGDVLHGTIRELSLVLSGANPGAYIDSIMVHGELNDDEAIIYTNDEIELYHSDTSDSTDKDKSEVNNNLKKEEEKDMAGKTVKEVYDSMTDEQKDVVNILIGAAVEEAKGEEGEEGENMKQNAFDNSENNNNTLIHDGLKAIIADAKRCGSLKESYLQHAADYGIDNIDWLQPEYRNIDGNGAPSFIKRQPDAWVDIVMNGVHHTPFAKIKMMFADLRDDDARARGYAQKGKLKKEEVFGLLKRSVDPTTVYKKQKLDREDVVDITDFDVISWLKAEMRMMLDEEIARAILFGDGRSASSEDKIDPSKIIPIYSDASLYTISQEVTPASGESFSHAFINAAVKAQDSYEGSGNTLLFTANTYITDMLLMEDNQGHRLYKDMNDLALAMSVNKVVKVPASILPAGVYGLIVDLKDYNVGADKGGAVNMFDDFDIDYNQQKYLIETRCSGALTKPFSAIVLKAAE